MMPSSNGCYPSAVALGRKWAALFDGDGLVLNQVAMHVNHLVPIGIHLT